MNLRYENKKTKQGYKFVIGCDEVGRGCLAGPVVAAAVIFNSSKIENFKLKIAEIKDSKLLTAQKREELAEIIKLCGLWSIAEVSSEEIDEINIHNASLLAMRMAVEGLFCHCECIRSNLLTYRDCRALGCTRTRNDKFFLSVDGKFKVPGLSIAQESIIGGDNKVLSIAAASIIAKVYRDSLMKQLDKKYPSYNLKQHKGYATEYHRKVILEQGLSPIHRLSFCQSILSLSLDGRG